VKNQQISTLTLPVVHMLHVETMKRSSKLYMIFVGLVILYWKSCLQTAKTFYTTHVELYYLLYTSSNRKIRRWWTYGEGNAWQQLELLETAGSPTSIASSHRRRQRLCIAHRLLLHSCCWHSSGTQLRNPSILLQSGEYTSVCRDRSRTNFE
jgi:hypothetical protein